MSLTVLTWIWGDKYGPEYVARLRDGVRRWLRQPHDFVCVVDGMAMAEAITTAGARDFRALLNPCPGLRDRGCFCRLRTFDPAWQRKAEFGDHILSLDLDAVVVGPLDPLIDRHLLDPLTILQGVNAANPCPYNGSMSLLRAGTHPEVWSDFSLGTAAHIPHYEFPDDQGWIHYKVPDAEGFGPGTGVYAFQKPGWPGGEALPAGARVVFFPGRKDPAQYGHLRWVRSNWRVAA